MRTIRVLEWCVFWTFLSQLNSREVQVNYASFPERQLLSNEHDANQQEGQADAVPGVPNNNLNGQQEAEADDDNIDALSSVNELYNMTEEEERQWRMEMIKIQFLAQIPDMAPANTTIPKVPAPLRFIEDPVIQRDQPDQPRVSQVVFFAEPAPARARNNEICIYFNLTSYYSRGNIHSVELWMYKRRSRDHSNHTYVVSKISDRHYPKPVILASERVGIDPGWIEFKDVTLRDKVKQWARKACYGPWCPSDQIGSDGHLMIACPTCGDEAPPIVIEGNKKPFLVFNFKKIKKRSKRRTHWCGNDQTSCCKKILKFNFHDAGLKAFIEPREYQPNYCDGSCSVRQHPETLNMASGPFVSVIMQSRAFEERGKAPCCAPNKLSSQTVLYYNQNGLMVRKTLEKMVVDSCGCH